MTTLIPSEPLDSLADTSPATSDNSEAFQVMEATRPWTSQPAERLNRLFATIKNVAQSFELAEILPEIIKDASQLLNAESGDILLWDRECNVLKVVAVYEFPPDMLYFEMPMGEGLTSQAMASRRPVMVPDYLAYPRRAKVLDHYRFKAVLSVPLISRGQALGAINIHSGSVGYRYSEDDINLLAAFADHAAVAIDNAQRYENEKNLVANLRRSNERLSQSLAIQSQFTQQALHGRGLTGLAQRLASLIHHPVLIEDPFFHLLASSKANGDPAVEQGTPIELQNQPDFKAALTELIESRQASTFTKYMNRLIAPLLAADDGLGYLTVLPGDSDLNDLDRVAIELAATNCALELVKQRAAFEAEARLRGDFVLDLIGGNFREDDSVISRATFLGYDLQQPYEVLVCDIKHNLPEHEAAKLNQRLFQTAHRFVLSRSPKSLVAAQSRSLIILLACMTKRDEGTKPAVQLARALKGTLEDIFPQVTLALALGDTCRRPADFTRSYDCARSALDLMNSLGRADQIIDSQALGFYGLLLQSNSPEKLAAYARTTFQALRNYDDAHHTDLLRTLQLYFQHGGNKQSAARAAFLHVNTLTYRLRKVQEMLNVDLRKPDDLLHLQFALKVLDVMDVWQT